MKRDPINQNFCENTGGYVWQVAEYLQHDVNETVGTLELAKAMPPCVPEPNVPFPSELDPTASIKWASGVRITPDFPALLGSRGTRTTMVVMSSTGAFGGFDDDFFVKSLLAGTTVRSFTGIKLNGQTYPSGTLLITLMRHGFITCDQQLPKTPPTAVLREPTCTITNIEGFGSVAINRLNGRTVRLNEASKTFLDQACTPQEIKQPIKGAMLTFIEAGMGRLITEDNKI